MKSIKFRWIKGGKIYASWKEREWRDRLAN